MVTKTGKLISKEGKYFLDLGGRSQAINEKALSDPAALKGLVGKDVDVEFSEGDKPFVVSIGTSSVGIQKGAMKMAGPGAQALKRVRIVCYVPPADKIKIGISDAIKTDLAQRMVKEGLITKGLADKISIK